MSSLDTLICLEFSEVCLITKANKNKYIHTHLVKIITFEIGNYVKIALNPRSTTSNTIVQKLWKMW